LETAEIGFSREAARQYKRLPKGYKSLVEVGLSRLPEDVELDPKPAKGDSGVANEAQG
jgi:mRNA-degrading endonuclease RelE of RelBE toxin-antitoxin system